MFPPNFQIKNIHSIGPATIFRVNFVPQKWVGKVQILVKTVENLPTSLHSSICISETKRLSLQASTLVDFSHQFTLSSQHQIMVRDPFVQQHHRPEREFFSDWGIFGAGRTSGDLRWKDILGCET